jgi:hypothetical protein
MRKSGSFREAAAYDLRTTELRLGPKRQPSARLPPKPDSPDTAPQKTKSIPALISPDHLPTSKMGAFLSLQYRATHSGLLMFSA